MKTDFQKKEQKDLWNYDDRRLSKNPIKCLKPGRWLTMVYSYTDPSMYRAIQRMAHDAGFIDEGEVTPCELLEENKAPDRILIRTQQRFLSDQLQKA